MGSNPQGSKKLVFVLMPFSEEFKDVYFSGIKLACEAVGVDCHEPEGGMYVMVDVRETGLSAYEFAHALLEQEKVGLLPGEAFGPTLAGYLRISLTAPEAVLAEACERIQRFVASLGR